MAWQETYYHYDGMGNTVALTDESGQPTGDQYVYSAFGEFLGGSVITENSFLYNGRVGYYHDGFDTDEYYVRRRSYAPILGRWLSQDPLGLIDRNSYNYADSRPVDAIDPSGLLSIVPAHPQHLTGLTCGETASMGWDFLLDVPRRPGGLPGAPCDGFIVQHVTVGCVVNPCQANGDCTFSFEQVNNFEYWEAWAVRRSERGSHERKRGQTTDTAFATATHETCGTVWQLGEVRFYCKNRADDPTGNRVGTSDLSDWHTPSRDGGPRGIGPGACTTTPGNLRSTVNQPAFWNQPPVDGNFQFRYFSLTWFCCRRDPKKCVFAIASPPLVW